MDEKNWLDEVKARGWAGPLRLMLDALAPLGPLGAQMLYVFQPVASVFGRRDVVGQIARKLEEPGGVEDIRRQLDDES